MEGGEVAHHAFVLVLLVGMDGLGMLAEVVETRELLGAVASEGTLAGVLAGGGQGQTKAKEGRRDEPDVPGEMLAPAEDHATVAKASALERLRRGRAVSLADALGGRRGDGEEGGVVGGDEGGHLGRGEAVGGIIFDEGSVASWRGF